MISNKIDLATVSGKDERLAIKRFCVLCRNVRDQVCSVYLPCFDGYVVRFLLSFKMEIFDAIAGKTGREHVF